MGTIGPKNSDMQFDRTVGQDGLEITHLDVKPSELRDDRKKASLVTHLATCAVHGCFDGESTAIEYERWDGMS